MLDALGTIISAIDLILARKDRRADKQASSDEDFRTATLDLYDLASTWASLAEELRHSIRDWHDAGCPTETSLGVVEDIIEKEAAVEAYQKRSMALRKFLQVYSPETNIALATIARRSSTNLKAMVSNLLAARDASPETLRDYIQQFETRTDEVLRHVETLRLFVVATFPPT